MRHSTRTSRAKANHKLALFKNKMSIKEVAVDLNVDDPTPQTVSRPDLLQPSAQVISLPPYEQMAPTTIGPEPTAPGRPFLKRVSCFVCDSSFRSQLMRLIAQPNGTDLRDIAHFLTVDLDPAEGITKHEDKICTNCHRRAMEHFIANLNKLSLNCPLVASICCIVCCKNCTTRMPVKARVSFYVQKNLYVFEDMRCCTAHLNSSKTRIIQHIIQRDFRAILRKVFSSGDKLTAWFNELRVIGKEAIIGNFEDEDSFKPEDFKCLFGITVSTFKVLYSSCKDKWRVGTEMRKISRKELTLFLMKLRQGLSDRFLKSLMNFSSHSQVSMAVATVKKKLMKDFVPKHLGCSHIASTNFIANHVPDFHKTLYNPDPSLAPPEAAIVYIDGIYLYMPNSRNYSVLRRTFCVHKGRHLVKPIMVVAPDGYILDIHRPYFSNFRNNDASCLVHKIKTNISGLKA